MIRPDWWGAMSSQNLATCTESLFNWIAVFVSRLEAQCFESENRSQTLPIHTDLCARNTVHPLSAAVLDSVAEVKPCTRPGWIRQEAET